MATEVESTSEQQLDDITAKANSLREQFRPYIEEKSLRKLQKNYNKITEFGNLKFKVTQKYLNLKNGTKITFNNFMNKVHHRSKFLDNYVPSNSFLFNNKLTNVVTGAVNNSLSTNKTNKKSNFSPAILSNNNEFKINSKVIRTISRENLELLENKLSENELLFKQINDYRNKLSTINEILEEMEQVNQEVIIEEDQETVKKDELMKQIEIEQSRKLDEINLKKEKIEADLGQCMELYKSLKMELSAVQHKKNFLKAKSNEQKRIYADVSMKLKNLIDNNRREMNEIQRKIIERRERDLAIIKAFRIRKIEITKSLEEKENLVRKNLNLSTNDGETLISENSVSDEKEVENRLNDEKKEQLEIDDDDAAYNEYNLIEEFNPEMNVKVKYFKEIDKNYRICRKDIIWQIKLSNGARLLSDEQLLEDVEGIIFVDEDFNQIPSSSKDKFEIGKGYFSSKLYSGKSILYKTYHKKLIIKKFNFDKQNNSKSLVANELLHDGFKICSYLAKNPHKNIVEILDIYSIKNSKPDKSTYYLVEEYCLSTLEQFIGDLKDELYLNDIKTIGDGLANALFYLHSIGIAHQNVCPQTIQINESKIVKLGYMEGSTICFSTKENCFNNKFILTNQLLDKRFAAPEILDRVREIDPIKADVYSYGLILAFCYKRKPFVDLATKNSIEVSEAAASLIENCLSQDPDSRYSMLDVVIHCYFN